MSKHAQLDGHAAKRATELGLDFTREMALLGCSGPGLEKFTVGENAILAAMALGMGRKGR